MIAVEGKEGRELHPAVAEFFVCVAVEACNKVSPPALTASLVKEGHLPQVSTPNMGMPKSAKLRACTQSQYDHA